MFSLDIIDSDQFLDMPLSSRCLYYDLGMRADDDGFVSPRKILRLTGATADDLNVLVHKKFIIPFESGVIVIKDWKMNNYIQKDRYTETIYKEEKAKLLQDDNNSYLLENEASIQNVYKLDTQDRLGKDRLGKDRLGKVSKKKIYKRKSKYSSIKSIGEKEIKEKAEKYQVPIAFVKSKIDDLENYCERTGRRYKNYLAALDNFVKKDAMKIRKEQLDGGSKRAIDASGL